MDVDIENENDDDDDDAGAAASAAEMGLAGDDGDLSQVVSPLGENAPLSALTTAEPVVPADGSDEMDNDVENPHISQQQQQHHHHRHQQQQQHHRATHSMHAAFPLDTRGELALGGAETEVEGDGNGNITSSGGGRSRAWRRARGAGAGAGAATSSSTAPGTRSGAASPLPLTLDETMGEVEAEAEAELNGGGGVDEELGMMAIDEHAHRHIYGHDGVRDLETNPFSDMVDATLGVGGKRKR